ncbi:hypothetical protein T439DRAFT_114772 [Meredithblackwellia eburnea MCA 4105]
MPRVPGTSTPELRKSCSFCRRRKIRCSGEHTGCQACIARKQACIYEESSPMGRPRKNAPRQPSDKANSRQRLRPNSMQSSSSPIMEESGKHGLTMSQKAFDLAVGEAEPQAYRRDPVDELAKGMLKLRLSTNVRTTFSFFSANLTGDIVQAFYGLVSSNPAPNSSPFQRLSAPDFAPPYRIPQGTRFLYEVAIKARQASRPRSEGAVRICQEALTSELWRRFPCEIVSLATAGIPSSYDPDLEEPLFVRLLKEDESTGFENELELLVNPLLTLLPIEINNLVRLWFLHSPYCFFINDHVFLSAIEHNTVDPALLSIVIALALAIDPSHPPDESETPLHTPSLESFKFPQPPPSLSGDTSFGFFAPFEFDSSILASFNDTSTPPQDPLPFIRHAEHLVFARAAEEAVSSITTLQTILLLGAYYGSNHRTRQSWGVMCTGYALAREGLKRLQSLTEKERSRRSELQVIEDEQLINIVWIFAVFGSWSFLSLGLPRSTLIEVTDSLPLPPVSHHDSFSYKFRSKSLPHIPEANQSLRHGIRGFNETCRALALIVTLSVKNAVHAPHLAPPSLNQDTALGPQTQFSASPQGFSVLVAQWLIQQAEQHASPHPAVRRRSATLTSAKEGSSSLFLSCVNAIMALHRLAPFDQPFQNLVISAPGLKLSIRAIELLVHGSEKRVNSALANGGGRVLPDTAKFGLLRMLGDALPHCLRLMDHLAESAKSNADVYLLVFEEKDRIAHILDNLIRLTDCGVTTSGGDTSLGTKRVQLSLAGIHQSAEEGSSTVFPKNENPLPMPSAVRIPTAPFVPQIGHDRCESVSSDSIDSASTSYQSVRLRSGSNSSAFSLFSDTTGRSRSESSTSAASDFSKSYIPRWTGRKSYPTAADAASTIVPTSTSIMDPIVSCSKSFSDPRDGTQAFPPDPLMLATLFPTHHQFSVEEGTSSQLYNCFDGNGNLNLQSEGEDGYGLW